MAAVVKRIQYDSSEIVGKTGKKLILELQKCYPKTFKSNYVESIENSLQRSICSSIVEGNESEFKRLIKVSGS